MQLGTRWSVGQEPPAAVPEAMVVAVREVEDELAREGVDASAWRWTLTWLERRPIAELDDGTRVHLDPLGHAVTTAPREDDDPAED